MKNIWIKNIYLHVCILMRILFFYKTATEWLNVAAGVKFQVAYFINKHSTTEWELN